MKLQYVSDNKGEIIGVFIPIQDWKYLKNKYKEIEQEERAAPEIQEWHTPIGSQKFKDHRDNPDYVLDWDNIQKEIEGEYGF